jgi:multiple sugar transport system ATP-binding protein
MPNCARMITELKRLHRDTDSTFVYVTHDQLEAMTLATRTCLIHKGLMQQYDKPLNVYNHPTNLFVARLCRKSDDELLKAKARRFPKKY